jgi:hypothetical protein
MPLNEYDKKRLQRRDARILAMLKTSTIPLTAKRFRLTTERVRQIKQACASGTAGVSEDLKNVGKSYTQNRRKKAC